MLQLAEYGGPPLVVSFSVNVSRLFEKGYIPASMQSDDYTSVSDSLEESLMTTLRAHVSSLCVQTDASARDGETLSLRVAFWNLPLHQLEQVRIEPWTILEISQYSEIYDQDWNQLFPRAVVDTYQEIISDSNDIVFGLGRCPRCGATELRRSELIDYQGDETYAVIECATCKWYDWSQ